MFIIVYTISEIYKTLHVCWRTSVLGEDVIVIINQHCPLVFTKKKKNFLFIKPLTSHLIIYTIVEIKKSLNDIRIMINLLTEITY